MIELYDFSRLRNLLIKKGYSFNDKIIPKNTTPQTDENGLFFEVIDGMKCYGFLYQERHYVYYNGRGPNYPVAHPLACSAVVNYDDYKFSIRNNVSFECKETRKKYSNKKLKICKNCNQLLQQKGVGNFDSLIINPVPIRRSDGYVIGWDKISLDYREEKDYTCEICGKSYFYIPEFVHCHHRDGAKTNNNKSNLQCLCIRCHAEIHTAMKEDKEYKYFMEYIYDGR